MADQASRVFASPLAACAVAACLLCPARVSAQQWLLSRFDLPKIVSQSGRGASSAGAAKDAVEITFTGYQSLPDGRGIVFVELSDPVAVEVSRTGQVVEYKLLGARVPLRNNKNPLLLAEFGSSALSAVLVTDRAKGRAGRKQRGRSRSDNGQPSVTLVVTLRSAAIQTPTHRLTSHGKGAALEVELAPSAGK
jgi:hypothetical protein